MPKTKKKAPRQVAYMPLDEIEGAPLTTLIAAARQGRRCYGLEISPAYCDVIRRRWGDYARGAGIEPGPDAL